MRRQLKTDEDKTLLHRFRNTYKTSPNSLSTFVRYREGRKFIMINFNVDSDTKIRRIIFTKVDDVIRKVKEAYPALGSQNNFLSTFKVFYDNSRYPSLPVKNPYKRVLAEIRSEIEANKRDNSDALKIKEEIKAEVGEEEEKVGEEEKKERKFTKILTDLVRGRLAELNSWISDNYGVDNVQEFNKKYSRALAHNGALNGAPNLGVSGAVKYVNLARSILAIFLQTGSRHILRAEHRSLKFYRSGNKEKQNYLTSKTNKMVFGDYKTVDKYGVRYYNVRDLDMELIRFIRVFTPSKYIFSTAKGGLLDRKGFGRLYSKIHEGLTPTKLRKIIIDELEKDKPFSGNSEKTREKYYKLSDEEKEN